MEGNKIIVELSNGNVIHYLRDSDGDLKGFEYNSQLYYYRKNILGDIIAILDENFNVIAKYEYDSWGNILSIKDSNDNLITSDSHVANINPFRYRSYYFDKETGLYYLGNRYYSPEWKRFLNCDSYYFIFDNHENFLEYNLYLYCNNNPMNKIDENGNFSLPNWAKKAIAAVAVVAVVATVAAITVAVAGPGTVAAVIAVGAAKGALVGMAVGGTIGAGTAVINNRIKTGSWKNSGKVALEGAADGALTGSITGTITGAASSTSKVLNAAKSWDSSSMGGPLKNMNNHYYKHVIEENKRDLTKNVLTYTQDAIDLMSDPNAIFKMQESSSIKITSKLFKGFYSDTGLIRSFIYFR